VPSNRLAECAATDRTSGGPLRAKVLLVGWQLLELAQAVWLSWVIELLSEQPLEPLRPQLAQ